MLFGRPGGSCSAGLPLVMAGTAPKSCVARLLRGAAARRGGGCRKSGSGCLAGAGGGGGGFLPDMSAIVIAASRVGSIVRFRDELAAEAAEESLSGSLTWYSWALEDLRRH